MQHTLINMYYKIRLSI